MACRGKWFDPPRDGGSILNRLRLMPFVIAASLLLACAAPGPGGSSSAGPQTTGPKTLRMAMHTSNEPVGSLAGWGSSTAVSSNDMNFVFHAGLTTPQPSEQTVASQGALNPPRGLYI